MFKSVTGQEIRAFKDIVLCSSIPHREVLKSAVVKALLLIDRNLQVPDRVVTSQCAHLLRIESIVNVAERGQIMSLVNKLNDIT